MTGSVIYTFSVPRDSDIDRMLHRAKKEAAEGGTSFSAWVCATLDPDALLRVEALRAQTYALAAGWLNELGGTATPDLLDTIPKSWTVNGNPIEDGRQLAMFLGRLGFRA